MQRPWQLPPPHLHLHHNPNHEPNALPPNATPPPAAGVRGAKALFLAKQRGSVPECSMDQATDHAL